MGRESEKIIKEDDLSDLISDADSIFSQYVRLKYADNNGIVACFTCGNKKHWTLQQAGHYMKRGHLYLRWDERNVKPQDRECNEYEYGNMAAFTQKLELECRGITEILKAESMLVHKPTREEIRLIIAEYTPKVKELKLKLKNNFGN